jgi:hypothetical protein
MKQEDNIPTEHKHLVLSRIDKAKENPERLLDWDEVLKQELM